ncbi:hypothetical protein GOV11_02430 [Candidatus Woesearchaeota archaeon]|nr:hypothetical protein [Candidatus Woesearchaeota archaeon]
MGAQEYLDDIFSRHWSRNVKRLVYNLHGYAAREYLESQYPKEKPPHINQLLREDLTKCNTFILWTNEDLRFRRKMNVFVNDSLLSLPEQEILSCIVDHEYQHARDFRRGLRTAQYMNWQDLEFISEEDFCSLSEMNADARQIWTAPIRGILNTDTYKKAHVRFLETHEMLQQRLRDGQRFGIEAYVDFYAPWAEKLKNPEHTPDPRWLKRLL